MKTFLTIVLCLMATVSYAAQKTAAKLDYDAAYSYCLTVTEADGANYFTVSLMNNGTLSYEYWVDSTIESENTIKLADAKLAELKTAFADAAKALPKANDAKSGSTLALEEINGRQSTTWTVVGASAASDLLSKIKSQLGGKLPFAVN